MSTTTMNDGPLIGPLRRAASAYPSKKRLAMMAEVDLPGLYAWLKGNRGLSVPNLEKIATVLGATVTIDPSNVALSLDTQVMVASANPATRASRLDAKPLAHRPPLDDQARKKLGQ